MRLCVCVLRRRNIVCCLFSVALHLFPTVEVSEKSELPLLELTCFCSLLPSLKSLPFSFSWNSRKCKFNLLPMYCQPLTAIAIATPSPGESGGGLVETEKKINLDLEIGRCACASGSERGLKREKRVCIFTGAQFEELCNQIYICNSIAYGFPVGFQLLYPIWISVFKSLGPAISNTFPTLSGFSGEKCGHSSVMDSEPGRCRRTDGRKWRCSKNVLPLQKYCQRHMHRGRQCSRKHVEPIERLSTTDNRASDDTRMPVMSLVASDADVDSRVSVAIRSDISPSQTHSSYYSNGFPAILKCRNDECRDATLANNSINDDYARSTCASSRTNCLISGGDGVDGNPISLSSRKPNVVGNNYVGFNSSRYGLSPKSVLNAAGKIGLGSGCTSTMEAEQPQRCRRTDGKKWQCRRDALHNQKYCDAHMHRGAKRLVVRPEYSRRFQATPTTITRNLDSGINLNTVPASPRRDGTSRDSSSSTSDATTITDENISFLSYQLSPIHHG